MADIVQVAAHTRSGGQVQVAAHTRTAPAAPATVPAPAPPAVSPPGGKTTAAPPVTVPGGAAVKPPVPLRSTFKPADLFVSQQPQTVGVNPHPPATRKTSVPADSSVPLTGNSPTGFNPYFNVY